MPGKNLSFVNKQHVMLELLLKNICIQLEKDFHTKNEIRKKINS